MAGTTITNKGLKLIAKLLASGTELVFTKAEVGTGRVPPGYDMASMMQLAEYKINGNISGCSAADDQASVTFQISSIGIEEGFVITEAGLYAQDPDEGEILYAYFSMTDDPQYVYPQNDIISKFVEITLIVIVGQIKKVTAAIDVGSLIIREEFVEKIEEIHQAIKAVTDKKYVTIPVSDWSDVAPYTQIVDIEGITVNDSPIAGIEYPNNINEVEKKAIDKSVGMITRLTTVNGGLMAECKFKKPVADIPLVLKGV